MKALILEGDPDCFNLVASSIYGTKPVHYLSIVKDQLKWRRLSKPVFNGDTGEIKPIEFLQLNLVFTYNKDM